MLFHVSVVRKLLFCLRRSKMSVSFKEPCSPGRGLLLFSSTPRNDTLKLSNSTSNAMIDYSVVKCKLMEPRIGSGYAFSERSEFHGFVSDPLKWWI